MAMIIGPYGIIILGIIILTLFIIALRLILKNEKGINQHLWILFLIIFPVIGSLVAIIKYS
jgi:hypothetical protein